VNTTAGEVDSIFVLATVVVAVPVALKGRGGADESREGKGEGGGIAF
jgi:hypothetical protein